MPSSSLREVVPTTAMQCIPAAFAARIPKTESSKASTEEGSAPSPDRAATEPLGVGLAPSHVLLRDHDGEHRGQPAPLEDEVDVRPQRAGDDRHRHGPTVGVEEPHHAPRWAAPPATVRRRAPGHRREPLGEESRRRAARVTRPTLCDHGRDDLPVAAPGEAPEVVVRRELPGEPAAEHVAVEPQQERLVVGECPVEVEHHRPARARSPVPDDEIGRQRTMSTGRSARWTTL